MIPVSACKTIGDQGDITTASDERAVRAVHSDMAGSAGNDTLHSSGGADAVIGGDGSDTLTADGIASTLAGADVALGDNGILRYDVSSAIPQLIHISASEPTHGGDDVIDAGAGSDTAIGGTGADQLAGGEGNDLLFGDHAQVDLALASGGNFTSIHTGAADGGGDDSMTGDGGDDTIIGGQGADQLSGGEGSDDLIGGHNVACFQQNDIAGNQLICFNFGRIIVS